jgi:putative ABC transport system substrate-binding protein
MQSAGTQMKRREFIGLLGGAAAGATWPLAARAQQPALPVIGLLSPDPDRNRPFHQGLAEGGYADGRNVTIEYRWSEGRLERYPELVADLVRRQVAVIAALGGIPAAAAAKAATTTIPVVFSGGFDPVEIGLVAGLARPGGNLTGTSSLNLALGPKRLEMMHELIPAAKVFALLLNPDHPNAEPQAREMQTAARALGLELRIVHARSDNELDAAFAGLSGLGAAGLVIGNGQPFSGLTRQLAEFATRHRMPTIFESREFVAAGGLVSYTGSRDDAYRLVGVYVARILKGEKPADLPVQQVTKVELIVNMKTAKALGITVPLPLLGRADEVIE